MSLTVYILPNKKELVPQIIMVKTTWRIEDPSAIFAYSLFSKVVCSSTSLLHWSNVCTGKSISSLEPLGLLRLRTSPPVATRAPTLLIWILIGQKTYRFEFNWLAKRYRCSKYLWNGTFECNTRSKDLRKERLMERLPLFSNTTRNILQRVCLRQPLGDRWKFVRKSGVGSRVSFRDQIETEAVMRLWERGCRKVRSLSKS